MAPTVVGLATVGGWAKTISDKSEIRSSTSQQCRSLDITAQVSTGVRLPTGGHAYPAELTGQKHCLHWLAASSFRSILNRLPSQPRTMPYTRARCSTAGPRTPPRGRAALQSAGQKLAERLGRSADRTPKMTEICRSRNPRAFESAPGVTGPGGGRRVRSSGGARPIAWSIVSVGKPNHGDFDGGPCCCSDLKAYRACLHSNLRHA